MRRPILPHSIDLSAWLRDLGSHINEAQPYREPTPEEVQSFLTKIDNGQATLESYDTETRRPFSLFNHTYGLQEAWGAVLIDRSQPTRLVIEAPHVTTDTNSEFIALELWRKIPGSMLIIAGAHRKAGGIAGTGSSQGLADPPWNEGHMFNKVASHMIPLPQVQIHGFSNDRQPDFDAVIATGSAPTNPTAEAIATALEPHMRVARYWNGDSLVYGAAGNNQSIAALNAGSDFTHVEMNYTVRTSRLLIDAVVDGISTVLAG